MMQAEFNTMTKFSLRSDATCTDLGDDEMVVCVASSPALQLLQGRTARIAVQLQAGECSADAVASALGIEPEEALRHLAGLVDVGCIEALEVDPDGLSRRSMLRRSVLVGAGAAAAPLIHSIMLPNAAAAFSFVNGRKTWTFQASIFLGNPTNQSNPIDSFYLLRGIPAAGEGVAISAKPPNTRNLTTSGGAYTAPGAYGFPPPTNNPASRGASLVGLASPQRVRLSTAVKNGNVGEEAVAVGWVAETLGTAYTITGSFTLVTADPTMPTVRLAYGGAPGTNTPLSYAPSSVLTLTSGPAALSTSTGALATTTTQTFTATFTASGPTNQYLYLIVDAVNAPSQVDVTLRIQAP